MTNRFNIVEERTEYSVHKRFHKRIRGPLDYILKIVGIDCDEKKDENCKVKSKLETGFWGPNDKFAVIIEWFLRKRKKRVRGNKQKAIEHEKVEEVV